MVVLVLYSMMLVLSVLQSASRHLLRGAPLLLPLVQLLLVVSSRVMLAMVVCVGVLEALLLVCAAAVAAVRACMPCMWRLVSAVCLQHHSFQNGWQSV
jgi:hypothetical protein